MAKAMRHDKVLAERVRFEMVAGNVYFPPPAVTRQYLTPGSMTTICAWKATAHYWAIML